MLAIVGTRKSGIDNRDKRGTTVSSMFSAQRRLIKNREMSTRRRLDPLSLTIVRVWWRSYVLLRDVADRVNDNVERGLDRDWGQFMAQYDA